MNFEFLKGLCGLGCVYKNCSNAEKLAVTMPVQSMFTARKSAEQLAKVNCLIMNREDVREEIIPRLLDIDSYNPVNDEEVDKLLDKIS